MGKIVIGCARGSRSPGDGDASENDGLCRLLL